MVGREVIGAIDRAKHGRFVAGARVETVEHETPLGKAPLAVAPLEPIEVTIGTREIVARDATGEKREVVEVKNGDTLELSIVPEAAGDQSGPAVPHLAPLSQYPPTPR